MKKFFVLLILPLLLFSSVIINKPFNQEILNNTLKNVPEIFTFKDMAKAIENQYGFLTYSHIPEIESNKKFFSDNKKYVGEFLNVIADSYHATYDVDEKKGKIVFKPLFSTFVKLPGNWDIDGMIDDLRTNYLNTIFKSDGNRIYAYGTDKEIKAITPILNNIEYITNNFIGYKKSYGNSLDEKNIYLEKVYF